MKQIPVKQALFLKDDMLMSDWSYQKLRNAVHSFLPLEAIVPKKENWNLQMNLWMNVILMIMMMTTFVSVVETMKMMIVVSVMTNKFIIRFLAFSLIPCRTFLRS